jgi:hypothetical protein
MEEDEDYGEDGALIDEDLDLKKEEKIILINNEEEDINSGATITEGNNIKNKGGKEVEGENDHQETLT